MASDQPASDLLTASIIGESEVGERGGGRLLEVILGVLSAGMLIHSRNVSDVGQPTGVVVRWRGTGREVLRLGSRTQSEAHELLASINAQLHELSVEEFCERWEVDA